MNLPTRLCRLPARWLLSIVVTSALAGVTRTIRPSSATAYPKSAVPDLLELEYFAPPRTGLAASGAIAAVADGWLQVAADVQIEQNWLFRQDSQGTVLWSIPLGVHPALVTQIAVEGAAVLLVANDVVMAYELEAGASLWLASAPAAVQLAADADTVALWYPQEDGTRVLSLAGSESLWTEAEVTGARIEHLLWMSPAQDLYALGWAADLALSEIYRLRRDGQVVWRRNLPFSAAAMGQAGGRLAVAGADASLSILDCSGGELETTLALPERAVAVAGFGRSWAGVLTAEGALIVADLTSGSTETVPLPGRALALDAIGRQLLVALEDGDVVRCTASRREAAPDRDLDAAPVVAPPVLEEASATQRPASKSRSVTVPRGLQLILGFPVSGGVGSAFNLSLRSAAGFAFGVSPMTGGTLSLSGGLWEHVIVPPVATIAAGTGGGASLASRVRAFKSN
jgi:hypothetical protein